jgi:hypothetical protein
MSDYKFVIFWKRHKFKIVVVGSFCVLLLLAVHNYRNGHSGSYSLEYNYDPVAMKALTSKLPNTAASYPQNSKGEQACREFLERVFMRPFPNVRPSFLKNSVTGHNLEIDCCNLDLRLGVEYNGRQHYEYVPKMHRTMDGFRTQQYRDEMKGRLCKENDFNLIVVPYTITVASIDNYLTEKLHQLGYKFI